MEKLKSIRFKNSSFSAGVKRDEKSMWDRRDRNELSLLDDSVTFDSYHVAL